MSGSDTASDESQEMRHERQTRTTERNTRGKDKVMGGSPSKTKNGKQTSLTKWLSQRNDEEDWDKGSSTSDEDDHTDKKRSKNDYFPRVTRWGAKDMEEYRREYPGKKDYPHLNRNFEFYTNKLPSSPDGDFIDAIHEKWWGDYYRLEGHHGYIQWLFPIRSAGMNYQAQELQLHEARRLPQEKELPSWFEKKINARSLRKKIQKATAKNKLSVSIIEDKKAIARVLMSYKLILDFYGMKLENEESGKVERADNWRDRFWNLNRSSHNYLRISRILKCLGELNYERLKYPWLQFLIHEAYEEKTLTNIKSSLNDYWIDSVKDEDQRQALQEEVEKLVKKSRSKDVTEKDVRRNTKKQTLENKKGTIV